MQATWCVQEIKVNIQPKCWQIPLTLHFLIYGTVMLDFWFPLYIEKVRWNFSKVKVKHASIWLYQQLAPTLTAAKSLNRQLSLSASQKIHVHCKQQHDPLCTKWHRKGCYYPKEICKLKLMLDKMKASKPCPCEAIEDIENLHTCVVVMALSNLWIKVHCCSSCAISQLSGSFKTDIQPGEEKAEGRP